MTDQGKDGQENKTEGQDNAPSYVRNYNRELSRIRWGDDEQNSAIWLITFTDIMALMLTFFVLLYSMVQPDVKKWEDITGALNAQFNEFYAPKFEVGSLDAISIDKVSFRSALNLDYLMGLIRESLQDSDVAQDIVMMPQRDQLILSMPQDLLFEPGQAEVGTEGKRVLFVLGGVLSNIKNAIEIVGHADPRPVGTGNERFTSNWDLSLARAASVADILTDVGYERKIMVRGAASGRFSDLPQDLGEQQRLSLARRVDIVILKNDGRLRQMLEDF